jgi:hypothetical protein
MLAHSPPLPLTVFYYDGYRRMTVEDEEGALLALSHRDRVHRIALRMPAPRLGRFIAALDGQFPILERLDIHSLTEEVELPQTFQAPNLHHFDLWFTALPTRSPLLTVTSTGGLVHLWLGGIPRSAYFPPNYILAGLSRMPQLETLGIEFHSPLPNHDVIRLLLDTPIMTHVTLPNLRLLAFVGVSAYLEGLVARMSAPVLGALHCIFSNQFTLTVPRLLRFMQTSENLIFKSVELVFDRDSIDLIAGPYETLWKQPLYLRNTRGLLLDWQLAFAVQVFRTLSPVLSVVEELTLSHAGRSLFSELLTLLEREQWRELLRPFSGVKTLHVQRELVEGLSHSLCSEVGETSLELLPNLQEVRCPGGSSVGDAFTPFIIERQTAGHIVRFSRRHVCPECTASYAERKALKRHFRDKHLPMNICGLCRQFKWPLGRIHLFQNHLRKGHGIPDASQGFLQHATISPQVPKMTQSPSAYPSHLVPSSTTSRRPRHSRWLHPSI